MTLRDIVYQIILTLLIAGGLTWAILKVRRWIRPKLSKANRVWDYALIRAADRPLIVLIWVLAIFMLVNILAPVIFNVLDEPSKVVTSFLETFQNKVVGTALVITLFWFIMRYLRSAEKRMEEHIKKGIRKRKLEKSTSFAVSQILKITLIITGILAVFRELLGGLSALAPLLTVGGIGGLAVTFAAKDSLANFIGGLMIFWDRPFSVGDWVRSPDRNIEGTVEHIGWRLTKIRTFDKRPLYVPNGLFSTISIENPSRMTNRRIKTTIGLRYEDAAKMNVILRAVEEMLKNHPEIDTKQTLMVNLFEFGPSSLNFFVYTFTKTTNWVKFQSIQEDVFLKIIEIITAHGAECAFPTRTVHFPGSLMTNTVPAGETT